jgi:hypothetical protein
MHVDGDRLVVTLRPFREPGAIPFMILFLPLWTLGGIAAIVALVGAAWGGRPFLLFWLCGWAVAEGGLVIGLAWLLWGRELLIVTPEQFEVRKEIGRFARTRRYDATRIQTVEAALVPSDDEGPERTDYCLKIINDGTSVEVGDGLSELEAEDLAAAVREFARPRRWWGEEEEWHFPELYRAAAAKRSRAPLVWGLALCLLVVATVIGLVFDRDAGEQHTGPRPRPAAGPDELFLMYASATAHATLVAAGAIPLEPPACTGDSMTRHWVCSARAASAGVIRRYRCESSLPRQHLDEPVLCAPRPPV